MTSKSLHGAVNLGSVFPPNVCYPLILCLISFPQTHSIIKVTIVFMIEAAEGEY